MKISRILAALVILGLIGAFVGYKIYNKPHADIRDQQTEFSVKTIQLVNEFVTDQEAAAAKYADKAIELSGEVYETEEGDSNTLVIFDQGLEYIINVELLEREAELQKGEFVKLKAFYQGTISGEPDFMIPGEIQFKKGIIID